MKQGLLLLALALVALACSESKTESPPATEEAKAPPPRVVYYSLGRT